MAAMYGLDLSKRIGVTDLTGQERARTGVIYWRAAVLERSMIWG
jgi:hypothetical protein